MSAEAGFGAAGTGVYGLHSRPCFWVLGFGGRASGNEACPRVKTHFDAKKIQSSLLLLEIFLHGVEEGNKYSLGFLYVKRRAV